MGNVERKLKKTGIIAAALFCSILATACSTPQNAGDRSAEMLDSDPLEPLNRGIFQFNYAMDTVLLKPVSQGYSAVMPERGKTMVSNFVSNIKEPVTFFNSVLQADPRNSFSTLWRFMINSTFGIGGLFDVATSLGLKNRDTGFGDTLAIYGADAGPYIVIPIIGPSNVRDGFGRLGDLVMDPVSYTDNAIFYSIVGVKTIDMRYHNTKLLNSIYGSSLDPYSTMRSGYIQHRAAEVKNVKKERRKSIDALCNQDSK
jgi:phospholipid-binding lipoprotein MlaA